MKRRGFLRLSAAGVAAPFLSGTSTRAASPSGAPAAKSGAIEIGETVRGYRVDSMREHSINAYWIVGAHEVLCIDAYWRIPEAKEAMGAFEAITGRTLSAVSGIVVTHPHSDHYGGLTTMRSATGGARAFTSDTVHRVIRNDEHGFYANRLEDIPEDIPQEIPLPGRGLQDGISIRGGDQLLDIALLRGNEAIETALIYVPDDRVLITGDLVNNRTTPVLYQGGLETWILQLKSLRTRFPDAETIAPGHGAPGDFDQLVAEEIRYLETFSALVEAELERSDGIMSPTGIKRITAATRESFPNWRTSAGVPDLDRLIALNIGWTMQGWRLQKAGAGSPREFREPE